MCVCVVFVTVGVHASVDFVCCVLCVVRACCSQYLCRVNV